VSKSPILAGIVKFTIAASGTSYFHDNLISLRAPTDNNHGIIFNGTPDGIEFRGFAGFIWKTGSAGAQEEFRFTTATRCLDLSPNNNFINTAGYQRVSAQFDKTSSTTLSDVTGLSAPLTNGRTYSFRAILLTTSNSAGGVKAAIAYSSSLTAIRYEGSLLDANADAGQARSTTSGGTVAAVTAVTAATITIQGTITPSGTGNLTVQFAQNASNGTASSVLTGSFLEVWDST
jgi:hypothetical protein